MRNRKYLIFLIAAMMAVPLTWSYSDESQTKPAILGGKIWSGSDTLDLGKKEVPDSLESQESKEEEDYFSGDITELPARTISTAADILRLKLSIPRNLKFLDKAPVILKAKSSNPDIVEIGEAAGQDPEKGFVFPITVNPGKADLFLYYRVVCCTTEGREACFFEEARLKIPVEVGDFEDKVISVRHDIDN